MNPLLLPLAPNVLDVTPIPTPEPQDDQQRSMLSMSGLRRYRSPQESARRLGQAQNKRAMRRLTRLLRERAELHRAVLAVAIEPACYYARGSHYPDESTMDVARVVVDAARAQGWRLDQVRLRPVEAVAVAVERWEQLGGGAS